MDTELKFIEGRMPDEEIQLPENSSVIGASINEIQDVMELTLNDIQWTMGFYGPRYYEITGKLSNNPLTAVSRAIYIRVLANTYNKGIRIMIPAELSTPLLIPQPPTLDMMREKVDSVARSAGLPVEDDGHVSDETIALLMGVNANSADRWKKKLSKPNPSIQRLATHLYCDIIGRGAQALKDHLRAATIEAKVRGFDGGFIEVMKKQSWSK
jgi:hypothetical protein